jgi:hypothetical protein
MASRGRSSPVVAPYTHCFLKFRVATALEEGRVRPVMAGYGRPCEDPERPLRADSAGERLLSGSMGWLRSRPTRSAGMRRFPQSPETECADPAGSSSHDVVRHDVFRPGNDRRGDFQGRRCLRDTRSSVRSAWLDRSFEVRDR